MQWERTGTLFFLTTGNGTVDVFRYSEMLLPAQPACAHSLHTNTANSYCIEFDASGDRFAVGGADAMVSICLTSDINV